MEKPDGDSRLRMRFRWANSISTRLRSRHDCSKASVLPSARDDVAGMLMDAARDLARRLLWTTSYFERADVAVELARPVQQLLDIHDSASGGEQLAGGQ
jgi:hypothetical protein